MIADRAARRRDPRALTLGAVVASGYVLAILLAPAARAAQPPTFEPGTLTSSFPTPVTWRFTFRSDANPVRVEMLTRLGNADTTFVSLPGDAELTHRNDGSSLVAGSDLAPVTPNTMYRARLRVTTADGTFLGPEASVLVSDGRFQWQVKESERLRAHWYQGGAAFGARVLQVGEDGVAKAEDFLGLRLPTKVDAFVYADESAFRDAIGRGRPENAAGVPFPDIATLFVLIPPEQIGSSWVADVVPHELTHLVLHAGIGAGVDMPLWLDEGFAVYLSVGYTGTYRNLVRQAIDAGTLVPLDGLSGDFPSDAAGNRSIAAYGEAVSAVDFMARTYGQAKIAAMIAGFASMGADPAFGSAFGTDTATFQGAWLADIGSRLPKAYGPLPAPSGPLPSDWAGPPPSAGLLPGESAAPTTAVVPTPAATSVPATVPPPSGQPSGLGAAVLLATLAITVVALVAALRTRRRREGGGP